MINLSQYINKNSIIPALKACPKEEAITTLIQKAYAGGKITNGTVSEKEACTAVLQREQLQSTGIGKEMAFPHARIKGWGGLTVIASVCEEGIEFGSIDDKPVKGIFLMISSTEESYIILQAMSAISRLFMETRKHDPSISFTDFLKKIPGDAIQASKCITAKEICRPVENYVTLETSLETVTRMMHFKRESVLPVIDQNDRLCGEISCHSIFDYGMPDFFKQLNTISFVRHIDPFEKYFKLQKSLTVKDVMNTEIRPLKEEATIAEIVFELTVKKSAKLFIINESGQLTGVIDQFSIVDQILFF
jgi:mannitol/fructose-specific phosphotransferase system IIA component (Ntr-type)